MVNGNLGFLNSGTESGSGAGKSNASTTGVDTGPGKKKRNDNLF